MNPYLRATQAYPAIRKQALERLNQRNQAIATDKDTEDATSTLKQPASNNLVMLN